MWKKLAPSIFFNKYIFFLMALVPIDICQQAERVSTSNSLKHPCFPEDFKKQDYYVGKWACLFHGLFNPATH